MILTELVVNALPFVIPINWLYGITGRSLIAAAAWMQVLYGIGEVTAALLVTHLASKWVQSSLKRHVLIAAAFVGVYMVGAAAWTAWAVTDQGIAITRNWLLLATIHSLQIVGIFLIVAILVCRRVDSASEIEPDA